MSVRLFAIIASTVALLLIVGTLIAQGPKAAIIVALAVAAVLLMLGALLGSEDHDARAAKLCGWAGVVLMLLIVGNAIAALPAAPQPAPPAATAPDEPEFVVIPAAIWNRIETVLKHWHERALAAEKRADKCGAA